MINNFQNRGYFNGDLCPATASLLFGDKPTLNDFFITDDSYGNIEDYPALPRNGDCFT